MRALSGRLLASAAAIAILATACGGSPAPAASPPASSGLTPSAAAAPASLAPTPSATTTVTTSAIIAKLGRPDFTLVADLTGSIAANAVSFPISGHLESAGNDSSTLLITKMPNGDQRNETVTVGGTTWRRNLENGPWVEEAATTTADTGLASSLSTLTKLEDEGTTTVDGRVLHRFGTPAGSLTKADLDISVPDISAFRGTLTLLVDDEADLRGIDVQASWAQPSGTTSIDVDMTMQFKVLSGAPSIEKPEFPWKRFVSKANGMSIAYPATFTALPERPGVPVLISLSTTDYISMAREPQPKGVTLDAYVKAYEDSWKQVKKVSPEFRTTGPMGSLPGVYETYHAKLINTDSYIVVGLTVSGRNGYFVTLNTVPGNEDNANAVFEAMATTLELNS